MKLAMSTPVQLVLAVSLVGSAVTVLQPESVELPILVEKFDSPSVTARKEESDRAEALAHPWQRPQWSDPIVTDSDKPQAVPSELPPLPSATAHVGSDNPPPLPSGTVSPQPSTQDIVYLGRMIRDGKTQVFFASNGGAPIVLNAGDVFNDIWKIQSITATAITLTHVRSGETRLIAIGGGAGDAPRDGSSTQIGQRFLASNPAGVEVKPVN